MAILRDPSKSSAFALLGWHLMMAAHRRAIPFHVAHATIPLPHYSGRDDRSPDRLAAAIAKRARKNLKRAAEAA